MKSIWNGSITFGLVDIPVRLYAAIQEHALGFTLLHETCHTPLTYHRWCPHCKEEVAWQDVVKGLEVKKGSYIVLTKEKLAQLRPAKSEILQVTEFVDAQSVPFIYFNNHYYVVPSKPAAPAYTLFTQALQKLHKLAIGKLVIKDKEHVCAIQPYDNGLLLNTLHYAYEVRPAPTVAHTKIDTQQLALAQELIKKLTKNTFDIKKFKDTFAQKIEAQLKQPSKKITKTKASKTKKEKSSLQELLKASLHKKPAMPAARNIRARA